VFRTLLDGHERGAAAEVALPLELEPPIGSDFAFALSRSSDLRFPPKSMGSCGLAVETAPALEFLALPP